MTDAVALKPDFGRFGVWTFGAVEPEQAVEIEKLGYGALWVGGSPAGDLAFVEPILEKTETHPGGHRDRERLGDARRRGRGVLSPHRGRLPGSLRPRHRHRASGEHRGVPQALRRARRVPGRARRREGADQPTRRRGAGAQGPRAGCQAQRGRAPVPDHARAHRPGARPDRQHRVPGARAQGGADQGRGAGPRGRPRHGGLLPGPEQLPQQLEAARLHRPTTSQSRAATS